MARQKSEVVEDEGVSIEVPVHSSKEITVHMLHNFTFYGDGIVPRPRHFKKGQTIILSEHDFHNLKAQRAQFNVVE